MTEDPKPDTSREGRPDAQEYGPAPGRLLWPLKRLWWGFEKYLLWPVADSFRRMAEAMRYRSPLAYIGATALVCLTAGAVATAVYFYNEAGQSQAPPAVAEAPLGEDTVVAPVAPPPVAEPSQPAAGDDTLKGVVPDFDPSAKNGSGGGSKGTQDLPRTAVRPSGEPDSPPLKVAHRFATTFVGYEIGEQKATRELGRSATTRLVRQLTADPPRLPSNGRVPKATVLNVVAGKKSDGNMDVSVSLMRSGATSELRLGLVRDDAKGWLVSEVLG